MCVSVLSCAARFRCGCDAKGSVECPLERASLHHIYSAIQTKSPENYILVNRREKEYTKPKLK